MQRCSKRGGESMNNRGVVNADRISELPEALIPQILCLLPIKVAITTSVLSKQWQSHWKMMPNLKFDSYSHKLELENVCKSLLSHKAPVLQSFYLRVRLDGDNAVDLGILIGIAFTRHVRELVLKVSFHKESFKVPRSLYNCETLETLKLRFCSVMDVPSSVYLKSLRTLHLYCAAFKDDKSLLNLLSGCPNLEDFLVDRDPSCSVKTFTIAVPSLQRLSIDNSYVGHRSWGYVINVPSLRFLEIRGFKAFTSCVIENLPELVEANISDVSEALISEKLMTSLTSVKHLSLALSPILNNKFPNGSIFHQLVYLVLHTQKKAWWNLLTSMLNSSPKLQVLKLTGRFSFIDSNMASGEWFHQPKKVPECLLFHLEIFMWEGYKWSRKEDRAVAKYILKNTNHLKRATFSFCESIRCEERLEVVKDLKSVVKATNSCQFQFKFNSLL